MQVRAKDGSDSVVYEGATQQHLLELSRTLEEELSQLRHLNDEVLLDSDIDTKGCVALERFDESRETFEDPDRKASGASQGSSAFPSKYLNRLLPTRSSHKQAKQPGAIKCSQQQTWIDLANLKSLFP